MARFRGCKYQKILIVGVDNAIGLDAVLQLTSVARPGESNVASRGEIDTATSQAARDGRIDVFIEVEFDRSRHVPFAVRADRLAALVQWISSTPRVVARRRPCRLESNRKR